MPGTSTERTCLTLKSSGLELLRSRSKQTGAPVAELVRRAVDAYLIADRLKSDLVRTDPASPDSFHEAGHEVERDKVEIVDKLLGILGFHDVDLQIGRGRRRSPRRHAGPIDANSL